MSTTRLRVAPLKRGESSALCGSGDNDIVYMPKDKAAVTPVINDLAARGYIDGTGKTVEP